MRHVIACALALFLGLGVAAHAQAVAAGESPTQFNNDAGRLPRLPKVSAPTTAPATAATPAAAPAASGPPCTDLINLLPLGCQPTNGGTASPFSGPLQDAINFFSSDFTGAAQLAVQIPSLQDGNGQACWKQAESVSALLKLHPLPLTLKVATDFEALRLLGMSINQMCGNPACTQVFTDLTNGVQSLGLNVSIPSFTSLCTKFPTIVAAPAVAASAAPVTTPATPAATPAQ